MRLGSLVIVVSVGAMLVSPVRSAPVPRLEAPTAVMFDATGASERTAPLTQKAGVCTRVAAGTAFPGDEGIDYSLNPGEAFAEAYRVLNETGGSASANDWSLVDPSFRPDQAALAAVREDVLAPWKGGTTRTIQGKFLRRNRNWTMQVATPLDGDLRLRLTALGGGADDVTLLSSDGRTVLAKASWGTSGARSSTESVGSARYGYVSHAAQLLRGSCSD